MLKHTFKFPEKSLSRWWEILVSNSKFTEKVYKAHVDNKKIKKPNEYMYKTKKDTTIINIQEVFAQRHGLAQH